MAEQNDNVQDRSTQTALQLIICDTFDMSLHNLYQ